MTKRMLIDSSHPEETRVVVLDGSRLEEFDVETSTKRQIKGNVYLAKVVRVEPSLQAAFVEYGGNRHGFLAFSEIHPDYYQIPVADREALIAEQEERQRAVDDDDDHGGVGNGADGEDVEVLGGEETVASAPPPIQANSLRNYKIQEVIKRRQILLVQVVKEERGNKGAALTTYLSLAGRYCVFMPNTARGGGVSRKISSQTDRRRLKTILGDLHGPAGGSVILRTAGAERSRAEIKRDFDFLMRQWEQIKATTLQSIAPSLIHEEGNLIKRAMRDIYTRDIEEIIVDGDEGYRAAKDFMKMLTPSHARKVQPYRDQTMPLFHRFQVESQLDAMHSPVAHLKSGGYLVLNQTEALVAIDVNSGKATKERHIEETALKTNLEAADEVARQLRLRDLAGLVVIDFIDMEESRNNAAVERRLKEALKQDRARIQVGRISAFGLMEMSRQRLRPSLMETAFHTCEHCHGTGVVRSIESTAIQMLRVIEEEGVRRRSSEVTLRVPIPVALYILNNKRAMLAAIEVRYDFRVVIEGDEALIIPDYNLDRVQAQRGEAAADPADAGAAAVADDGPAEVDDVAVEKETQKAAEKDSKTGSDSDSDGTGEDEGGSRGKKRRRRRRRPRRDDDRPESNDNEATSGDDEGGESGQANPDPDGSGDGDESGQDSGDEADQDGDDESGSDAEGDDEQRSSRSRRSRRRRGGRRSRSRRPEDEQGEDGQGEDNAETPKPANEDDVGDNGTEGVEDGAVALMEATETEWADVENVRAGESTESHPVAAESADAETAVLEESYPSDAGDAEGQGGEDEALAATGSAEPAMPSDAPEDAGGQAEAEAEARTATAPETGTEQEGAVPDDAAVPKADEPAEELVEQPVEELAEGSDAEVEQDPEAEPVVHTARRGWWKR